MVRVSVPAAKQDVRTVYRYSVKLWSTVVKLTSHICDKYNKDVKLPSNNVLTLHTSTGQDSTVIPWIGPSTPSPPWLAAYRYYTAIEIASHRPVN